jgi:hypothetical protein
MWFFNGVASGQRSRKLFGALDCDNPDHDDENPQSIAPAKLFAKQQCGDGNPKEGIEEVKTGGPGGPDSRDQ